MDCSSHSELIMTSGQEADGDNLGIFFDLLDTMYYGMLSELIRITLMRLC